MKCDNFFLLKLMLKQTVIIWNFVRFFIRLRLPVFNIKLIEIIKIFLFSTKKRKQYSLNILKLFDYVFHPTLWHTHTHNRNADRGIGSFDIVCHFIQFVNVILLADKSSLFIFIESLFLSHTKPVCVWNTKKQQKKKILIGFVSRVNKLEINDFSS